MYPEYPQQPVSPSDSSDPNASIGQSRRKGIRQWTIAALFALALIGGAVGGAGATVGILHWTSDESGPAMATNTPPTNTASEPILAVDSASLSVATAVYNRVSPAVVQVIASGPSRGWATPQGGGSGVVVDEQGLILTNYHVVAGAQSLTVVFSTGEERRADVLGTDSGNDLALLRVDPPAGVPAAALGDSDQIQVGETVVAIGSPFGLAQTVTQGIVSAVDRDWQPTNRATYHGLIQTDAPINPGNSGGPLVNASGEVIGINGMIESPVEGSVGVGFAIPINTAKSLLPQLESGAQLRPAWLGISGMDVQRAIATGAELGVEQGVLVIEVPPDSPAAAAGLQGGQGPEGAGGDVITALAGEPIDTMSELAERVGAHQPGDTIELTVIRSGREREVTVTLGAWPDA